MNNKPKFTPGPWRRDANTGRYIAAVGVFVAEVVDGQNADANANLIKAAPELYEALLIALDTIRTIGHRPDPDMEQEAVDTIRAALAKARGES